MKPSNIPEVTKNCKLRLYLFCLLVFLTSLVSFSFITFAQSFITSEGRSILLLVHTILATICTFIFVVSLCYLPFSRERGYAPGFVFIFGTYLLELSLILFETALGSSMLLDFLDCGFVIGKCVRTTCAR